MPARSILLTGDDGYNAIGIRLLAHFLKDSYDVCIAATKEQQSAMGGRMNLRGGQYGTTTIEGVPALWVDGSPVDAIECAHLHYAKEFDVVLSGINLGANVGASVISSGTFSAAFRSLSCGVSSRAIALSWNVALSQWFKNHVPDEPLDEYLEYPGKVAVALIEQALAADMWGATLLNINFPELPSTNVKVARMLDDLEQFYPPPVLNQETVRFEYQFRFVDDQPTDVDLDVVALQQGYITLSPCVTGFLHEAAYQRLKSKKISL